MKMWTRLARNTWPLLLALAMLSAAANAGVVINEVFYHAPDDIEDLEYIELHNSSDQPVDLSGWMFTKGIKFKFAPGTRFEANGFLVLCRNRDRFAEFYDAPVAGVFKERLSNKGERLELSDAAGKVVDTVRYADSAPWPMGADGFSGSLERISPAASGEDPSNWASSPLSENRSKPAGSPGKVNASFSASLPPVISNAKFAPENPSPDQPITVEADVRDTERVAEVDLLYRLAGPGVESLESSLPMQKSTEGHYTATIPGQSKDQLVRFRIRASNAKGAWRLFPAETEPRPTLSCYVHGPIEPAKIPLGWIINTTEAEAKSAEQQPTPPGRGRFDPEEMARFRARFTLEGGIDLPGAWFELTVNHPADLATLRKFRPVFAAKFSERDNLIDETLESSNIEAKLERLPDVIKTFQTGLAESLKPHLTEAQSKAFTDWLAKRQPPGGGPGGGFFGNPGAMVKSRINLEAAWYAVSAKAEIDEDRFGGLRKSFQELVSERNQLADQASTAMQQDDGFQKFGERIEALDRHLVARLKPAMSPAQEKQFEDWRNSRNMFGGGRPGGPGPFRGGPGRFRGGPGGPQAATGTAPSRSAFVYFDPATRKLELFDFVQVIPRNGGQKIHFLKDRLLNRMSTINLIFENELAVLAEPLAYEVYRKAGMAAEQSYHVRLWHNGRPLGYHLLVEQPNRAFLRRNNIRDDGNLYKILWYERGVVGQHEKKTHTREGHDDVVALVDSLEKSKGLAQWDVIRKHFDVEQVINYFAVNMVLSHWDGFFNNYFTYHDIKGAGKWTMYPWDQDQTWGIAMGSGSVFYDMPITFGMEGDTPPGQRQAPPRGRGFGFGGGGPGWWRPPGYFSGPLLANPQFRKLFLARTREILETIYTETVFGPIIEAMADRLRDEVRLRAQLVRENPDRALERFERDLRDRREHIRKRSEFLLAQDEIKNAGKFSRADLESAKPKR